MLRRRLGWSLSSREDAGWVKSMWRGGDTLPSGSSLELVALWALTPLPLNTRKIVKGEKQN